MGVPNPLGTQTIKGFDITHVKATHRRFMKKKTISFRSNATYALWISVAISVKYELDSIGAWTR